MISFKQISQARQVAKELTYPLFVGAAGATGALWTVRTLQDLSASAPADILEIYPQYTTQIAALAVAGLAVCASHLLYKGVAGRVAHLFTDTSRTSSNYYLPTYPDTQNSLQFVVGEQHMDGHGNSLPIGKYAEAPKWFSLSEKGLFTGLMVIGATGSAKTAGIIRPMLGQLLEYKTTDQALKIGGLIMDYKASLVAPVIDEMTQAGRLDDLIIIGPKHPYKWNPIHAPELESGVIAGRLLAILENISGQSNKGESSWIASAVGKMAEHGIEILRATAGYATIAALHTFITVLDSIIATAEDPTAACRDALEGIRSTSKRDPATLTELETDQLDYSCAYYANEYASADKRYRAMYLSELTRITSYFSAPAYRDLYSPAEADINFLGFNDAINSGRVVVLDANSDIYGPLAGALGIFLKLDFQRTLLSRPVRAREDASYNNTRPMCLIIDEYQEFASAGEPQFLALARESKTIAVFATQSRHSLAAKLGEEKCLVLLASLRSRIWLGLTDADDCELAAKHCGQKWSEVQNTNISESVQGAGIAQGGSLIGDETTVAQSQSFSSQKLNRFEPADFAELPVFTAIVSGFDGADAMPAARVLLKPYFKPRTMLYADFKKETTK